MLKDDAKVDPQDNGIPNLVERNTESEQPLKSNKSNDKCIESRVALGSENLTDLTSLKFKVNKDKMKVNMVYSEKVENKDRNKSPTGLPDQSFMKSKSDDKNAPDEKSVQLKVSQPTADSNSKQEDKLPSDVVINLKTSGSVTTEKQKNGKISGKDTDDLEGKNFKRTRDDVSFKVPDNSKTWITMNSEDLVVSPKEKLKSGDLDSLGNIYALEARDEQSGEKKRKLSMDKSVKVSGLSNDKDKKNRYREFIVTRKPKTVS